MTDTAPLEPGSEERPCPVVFMRFRPAWVYIDGIRDFSRFFCETTFKDPDLAQRAITIVQEALENGVKYSNRSPKSELELSIAYDQTALEIKVTSQPDPKHARVLKEQLDDLYKREPEEAYIAAFQRAAENPEAAARLGLARIRFEGGVDLSADELSDGRISLTAKGKL